ncbi:MAG: C25 family cysteine peptidase [Candidatus Electryonea clarkiae]|nr:C25 family cysteine peptidase [Candidatus Electryonea clarkiae]MDP8285458.1 C25 family cysteine peptidase [Candidatus Electryonea clarkiae]
MKKHALISLAFIFVFSFEIFAYNQVKTEVIGTSAQFVRNSTGENSISLSFSWDYAGVERFEEDVVSFLNSDEDRLDPVLSYRELMPTWMGFSYSIIDFDVVRSEEPFPSNIEIFLDSKLGSNSAIVEEKDRIIFRDISATPVTVTPFMNVSGHWYPLTEIIIRAEKIRIPGETPPNKIAESFREAYRHFMSDDELDEIGIEVNSGGYLLATPAAYIENLQPWIEWKRQCGYPVEIIQIPNNNPSFTLVRNMIRNAFRDLDPKPEFLLLVGDPVAGNNNNMPGDYVESDFTEFVITDHPYALINGDDHWPEIWVGRFSITSSIQALTISNKIVSYEMGEGMEENAEWLTRGLVICDSHYSSTGLTSSWIRREMLNYGFTSVDSVWYPPTMTAGPINNAINNGRGWVNYRGFGSPNSWQFPAFTSLDAGDLNNALMMPVVTSIVCGGGQFDNQTDPCLGEAFLRAGTPNSHRGAVAFVGPSELNTHTRWNNCLDMGIYQGVLQEGITKFGPAVFRGKMAVWNGFPNNRNEGLEDESAWFYFFTYNILGDPGLMYRTNQPVPLRISTLSALGFGANDLSVNVTDSRGVARDGIKVTLTGEGWGPYSLITGMDGRVRFDLTDDSPPLGALLVTATGFNKIPSVDTVQVIRQPIIIALDSLGLDRLPLPGAIVTLTPYLHHVGNEEAGAFTGELNAIEGGVDITDAEAEYPELGIPGSQASAENYRLEIPIDIDHGWDPGLVLSLDFDETEIFVRLPFKISAPEVTIFEENMLGAMPGIQAALSPFFVNIGNQEAPTHSLTISSLHPNLTIIEGIAELPELPPGAPMPVLSDIVFTTDVFAFPGFPLPFAWVATSESGRSYNGVANYTPGQAGISDPYGPDSHGYLVYDNRDVEYWNAPAFEWFEIDPDFNGEGTVLDLWDGSDESDVSVALDLPFTFTYYGENYDEITVCSNGWLKMGHSGEINFRNWNLPDGPGPMNMIAPYWDDLITGSGQVVWYHDEREGRIIIQWSRMLLLVDANRNNENSFQAVLYDPLIHETPTGDGDIEFYYRTIHEVGAEENFATIGIRNFNASDGLQIRYAGTSPNAIAGIRDERAYRITTSRRPETAAIKNVRMEVFDDGSNESEGNDDGNVNNGETIAISITAKNFGPVDAENIMVELLSDDPLVTILQGEMDLGNIESRHSIESEGCFLIAVDSGTPDFHSIYLQFRFEDDDGNEWLDARNLDVHSPKLEIIDLAISDDTNRGNDNGYPEHGETIEVYLTIKNTGRNGIGAFNALLLPDSQYATITDGDVNLDGLDAGEDVDFDDPFVISISPQCPDFYRLELPVNFESEEQEYGSDILEIRVGFFPFLETFEEGITGLWFITERQWHITSLDSYSPSHSFRWGDREGNSYLPYSNDTAISRSFDLTFPAWISFRYKSNMGYGDAVSLLVNSGADTILSAVLLQRSPEWTYFAAELSNDNASDRVQLSLQAQSNNFQEGTGFYIDDIEIYGTPLGTSENDLEILPTEYLLNQPYPSPFNSSVSIVFALPQSGIAEIRVFNILGQEVAVLHQGHLRTGWHNVTWNAINMASGLYFIQMEAGGKSFLRKIMLLK